MTDPSPSPDQHPDETRINFKKALHLEYLFVGYNSVEAGLSILFGVLAGSIALVGFGFDSILECLSALILIWRLRVHGTISAQREEEIESRASRFVAASFFLLGAYVLFESGMKLWEEEQPDPSMAGIFIALASLIVMPALGRKKYELGKKIGSRALVADSKETFVCAFLSLALLIGLVVNLWAGFWQADPIIGILIAIFLFKEGYEVFEEDDDGD